MKIFPVVDTHTDQRRTLSACRPSKDFPSVAEGKVLITHEDGVVLGNHSHPHAEGFFLVSGTCTIRTYTAAGGIKEVVLTGPTMFMFEPNEEHRLTCSKGMVLVGYMPLTYEDENNFPATHL